MESETVVRGPGFASLLTLLFIALKLVGVIAWPWVWVLAPLWIGFIVAVLIAVVLYALFRDQL